jgi:hypothetical protein
MNGSAPRFNEKQQAEIDGLITRALPRALGHLDPEVVIAALRKDEISLEGSLNRAISELVTRESDRLAPEHDLLEPAGEPIELPAVDGVFVGRQWFKADRGGKAPISYLGPLFRTNFLDVQEGGSRPTKVRQFKLLNASVDGPILTALGGDAKARIALGHVYEFLKTADRGLWYIFYVADKTGAVWAVDVIWHDGGWRVDADPIASPNEGRVGSRVISP